ncbi:hypothetical protein JCM8547_008202 [Rhodosporidiobolus lusitaniae]
MPHSSTAPNHSRYYLTAPTQSQLEAYHARRRPAVADPLEKTSVLAWQGPNLYPRTTPPSEYPDQRLPSPSPHPPRPLLTSLLSPSSPSHDGPGWSLRLIDPVQQGTDKWSQVWRCRVVHPRGGANAGDRKETVLLKLRHEALFPEPMDFDSSPEHESWNWWPAEHLVEREAACYSRFQAVQGRDVPLCYGFYRFDLPSGETAVGVVLEDLSETTIELSTYIEREVAGRRLSHDLTQALADSAFALQYRLQSLHILGTCTRLSDLLLVRSSLPSSSHSSSSSSSSSENDNDHPLLIATSFGSTRTLTLALNNRAAAGTEEGGGEGRERWRMRDQRQLQSAFERAVRP